ncbi:MAG: hypothetical protein RLZZ602_1337 [Pseudomonadota bacterium]|jgi:hypothetical protein
MYRSNRSEYDLDGIPSLSERFRDKISVALRKQAKPVTGSGESVVVPEPSKEPFVIGQYCEDVAIAVQAAQSMAKQFNQAIVIQEDLSVVPETSATKRILETFYP